MSDYTIERRDGRVTISEYRVVVTVGGRAAGGPWCFSRRDAASHIGALRRSLFDEATAERQLSANSRDRCDRIRQRLEADRRLRFPNE